MTIGEKVKLLRKARGFRQDALARACGVTPSCLSRLEAGENESPQADLLRKLALALGVPCDYITDPDGIVPYAPPGTAEVPPAGNVRKGETGGAAAGAKGDVAAFRVTREEGAFLQRLRKCEPRVLELVYAVPGAPIETLALLWKALYRPELRIDLPEGALEIPRGGPDGPETAQGYPESPESPESPDDGPESGLDVPRPGRGVPKSGRGAARRRPPTR